MNQSIHLNPNKDNQDLINKIESELGFKIDYQIDSNIRAPRAVIDIHEVKIIFRDESDMTDGVLFHELLHIHRIVCLKVPMLMANLMDTRVTPELERKLEVFDNDIEHLYIIPLELKSYPERTVFWEQKFKDIANYRMKDDELIRHYLFAKHILPDSNLRKTIEGMLEQRDIKEEADRIVDMIMLQLQNKERVVSSYLKEIGFDTAQCYWRYIDYKNNTYKDVPLVE